MAPSRTLSRSKTSKVRPLVDELELMMATLHRHSAALEQRHAIETGIPTLPATALALLRTPRVPLLEEQCIIEQQSGEAAARLDELLNRHGESL